MDLATIVAKMSQYGGLLPPGSDKVIKLMKEYPRSTVAVGSFVVIVTLWKYFKRQKYPAPWLDRRILDTGMTKKQILETDFKPEMAINDVWDVIVIGSGGSGLVAANMMSRAGLKVLVLERHYIVGGCTHTWEENGYEWDTGVHYVGESISHESPKSTGKVLKFLTDGKLKWEIMDDVYDIVKLRNNSSGEINAYPIEKRRVKDGQKWDTLEAMLKKEFPDEHEAIDKFIATIFGCSKSSLALGMYKVLPRPLLNFLIKLGLHDRIFDNYQLTQNTRDFLDSITDNPKLKCVMNYCFGDFGTNPNKAPLFMNSALFKTFMDGGFFPTGGSSEMTKTLAEPIWARGGKVLVRADVKEICVANGLACGVKVRPTFVGSDTKEVFVQANHIVSTTSAWVTNKLIKQPQLQLDLKHLTPGLGCFYVFFGMNENCPELPKKNWWLYNTDKYNFDDDVENFLKKSAQEYVESGPCLMFLSFPSQKDSDYKNRHTKGQTGVIITFANYEWFQELVPEHEQRWNETFKKDRMKRPEDYKAIKQRLGRRIVEEAQDFCDEVKFLEHVEIIKVGTPLTQEYYLNTPGGSIYSADHTLERFRPENLVKSRPETAIPNLTQGGQDILTCGVASTITSGMLAAGHALGRNLLIEAETIRKTL